MRQRISGVGVLAAVLATFVTIVTAYPLWYCLISSMNDGIDAAKGGLYLFPRKFTLQNYVIVFQDYSIFLAIAVTVLRTVVGTAAALLGLSMAAFALSKPRLRFRKFYYAFCAVTLYFATGVIPSYLLYKQIGLLDNFWVYVLPNVYQFFYLVVMASFFAEIPASIEESARIDGAGDYQTLFRIVLPLSAPVLSTVALFVGVWHWNDFFHPAFFITNERLMTLPAVLMRVMSLSQAQEALQKFVSNYKTSVTMEAVRYATIVVTVLPVVVIYPFLQRYFVRGMLLGAVKE
jgi:putative aldouronate transport system permease protein